MESHNYYSEYFGVTPQQRGFSNKNILFYVYDALLLEAGAVLCETGAYLSLLRLGCWEYVRRLV